MASLTKVRFLALQIDLKGRTDYNRHSLLEWISATTSFLFGEGPEPGSMSRAGSLQSRGTHSAQTMFSGPTRRKEGQQQFSAEGWQSSVLCSRQKCEPLKQARRPGKDTARDSSDLAL